MNKRRHLAGLNAKISPRCVRAIPDQHYKACLVAALSMYNSDGDSIAAEDCEVLGRTEGAYYLVVLIGLTRKGKLERCVFRVPARGTAALWRQEDRCMMEREVELMFPSFLLGFLQM